MHPCQCISSFRPIVVILSLDWVVLGIKEFANRKEAVNLVEYIQYNNMFMWVI